MKKAVGESAKREVWADKVEAALGTCVIAERIPELKKFIHDFIAAWNKVMNLDRFDLA